MPGSAQAEISDLISKIDFTDLAEKVAVSLTEIIVKGKPVEYQFEPDPELSGYYANDKDLWLDELNRLLLQRAGLFEICDNYQGNRKNIDTAHCQSFRIV